MRLSRALKIGCSRRSAFDSAPAAVRKSLWRTQASGIFAWVWEDLARSGVAKSARLASLAGDGDFWMPAGRGWHGNEPELDVVSFNGSRTRTLVGEAKWTEKPYKLDDVRCLAQELMKRPVPAHFPPVTTRVLFLSGKAANVPATVEGVEILDAREVCRTKRA